ncbi:hypothetical protein ACFLU3_03265 [Chloroflexota bacterium]
MKNLFRRFTSPRTVLLTMLVPIILVPLVLTGCFATYGADYSFEADYQTYSTREDCWPTSAPVDRSVQGRIQFDVIPGSMPPEYTGRFYNMSRPEFNMNFTAMHGKGCLRPLRLWGEHDYNGKKYKFEFNFCGVTEDDNDLFVDWFSLHTERINQVWVYDENGDCERLDDFTYILGTKW